MKKMALVSVLAMLLCAVNANALDYQITEYIPNPNPPQFVAPDGLYDDVVALGGTNPMIRGYNNSGQVVGSLTFYSSTHYTEFDYAFIWEASNGASLIPGMSVAEDINESGQVAGFYSVPWYPITSALIWDQTGGTQDIGSLGYKWSYSLGINDFGTVVGLSALPGGTNHAFIWNNQDGMKDLNNYLPANSGWVLEDAWDIDNNGEIIGSGQLNGQYREFIMTPTVVPEPLSSALFVTGGTLLAVRRFIRRKA